MTIAISTGVVRGTEEQDESFGQKLKLAEISGSESYSPDVRKIIDLGLNLTAKNLGYKINSADLGRRGMDSSGVVYYLLSQC